MVLVNSRKAKWGKALLACAALIGANGTPVWCDPLKATIQEDAIEPSRDVLPKGIEPMPIPVVPLKPEKAGTDASKLKGNLQDQGLNGQEDAASSDTSPLSGRADQNGPLKGQALDDRMGGIPIDPDADDKQLMVEWDRWRNHFLWAVQSGMQELLNDPNETNLRWDPRANAMVARFPLGTTAWFYCQVTPDRRVINLRITHSSGHPNYDHAVLEAINNLVGSSILRYPTGSRRKIVAQSAGIKTADSSEFRYFKFGDIEHQRTSN